MAALTALLYLAGGPANPFVSLYLVPVAIAAVGLDLVPVLRWPRCRRCSTPG